MSKTLELSEVLQTIRENLAAAKKDMDENLQLEINEIEVELQTVVSKDAGGKITLGIFDIAKAEINGKLAKVATQKIKLKISPKSLNPDSGEMEIAKVFDKNKKDGEKDEGF